MPIRIDLIDDHRHYTLMLNVVDINRQSADGRTYVFGDGRTIAVGGDSSATGWWHYGIHFRTLQIDGVTIQEKT